jgi:hypothetical protein
MKEDIKTEEYRYLKEETNNNRGYIFERPLLIMGIVAAAFQYISQNQSITGKLEIPNLLIPSFLIFVLYYNLTSTKGKLIVNYRIAAYIQLFHEGFLEPYWIGWENSMRYYRKLVNVKMKNKPYPQRLKNNSKQENFQIPKSLSSYRELYLVHMIFILLLLGFMIFRVLNISFTVFNLVIFFVVSFVILFSKMNPLHHSKFANHIEEERKMWLEVFAKFILIEHLQQTNILLPFSKISSD